MRMPDSVNAYFEAEQRADQEVPAAVFLDNAVVRDEGGSHHGLAAIRQWWRATKDRYGHTAMPIELAGTGDVISVCAVVTGRFPNSPVTLTFTFTLRDRKIAELEIS